MSQVIAFRVSRELREKLQMLCESMHEPKSTVLRRLLQVVSVQELQQTSRETSIKERGVLTEIGR